MIRNLGPHGVNKNAIDRYCKALAANKELLDNFDVMCQIIRRAGKHTTRSTTDDFRKVVKELVKEKVFTMQDGRSYIHFAGITDSLLSNVDINAMFKWIDAHKRKIILKQNTR